MYFKVKASFAEVAKYMLCLKLMLIIIMLIFMLNLSVHLRSWLNGDMPKFVEVLDGN